MPVVLCSAVRVLGQLRTRPRETRATTSVRCTVTVGFFFCMKRGAHRGWRAWMMG